MTKATKELVDEISRIVDKNKYVLLTGSTAVGKTFIAKLVADNCSNAAYNSQSPLLGHEKQYEVIKELVPIHSSYSYEDFIAGISISTENKKLCFKYEDKVFLQLLKEANKSWKGKDNKKYFLILDDIGRGPISGILGNMLPLIEPHGNASYKVNLHNSGKVRIPPNFYIIATLCTSIDALEQFNYGFLRHFYIKEIEGDFRYISDNASKAYSDFDITANAMFYRTQRLISDNLRHKYQMSQLEKTRYLLGHGIFKEKGVSQIMRHQVIPILQQYVKDGVLDNSARTGINVLKKLVDGTFTKDLALADTNEIVLHVTGINSALFLADITTHKPIVNIVSRIKEQGLLNDSDIIGDILFNSHIIVRKKAALDKTVRTFTKPGYLYVKKSERDLYTYGTTKNNKNKKKSPRFFYSGNSKDSLTVNGIEYSVASEMQPKEYTRWFEELDDDNYENERYSSSPNSTMFRIIRAYYKRLSENYKLYLNEHPGDTNIENLKSFVDYEYNNFVGETRKLHPEVSDEADVNLKANVDFRKLIGNLKILWTNRDDAIKWAGQTIKVEGVYKVNTTEKFKEYINAMETLNIHQMIMQGPPGTSKTYSSRAFLKYVGKGSDNDDFLTDKELDSFQIKDYSKGAPLTEWSTSHPGTVPTIAWDIVQFHPSYGYEDFVRGIEVSTVKSETDESSSISYETVNKILGNIADVASRTEYKGTKFYLLIDEINRANLATVFGELIYGLEYRGESVATPYSVDNSNKVKLPNNLYIIGTMNTADKSIGGIDYAIRRRFLFFTLLPDKSVIYNYRTNVGSTSEIQKQREVNDKAANLFDEIAQLFNGENLNSEYYKDDVQIGHTYFLVSSEEQLYYRFKYQILPILREYYKDGMFQFEKPTSDDKGWYGLLQCISGDIDINTEENKVHDTFNKLIEANSGE